MGKNRRLQPTLGRGTWMSAYHVRMPAILPPKDLEAWLDGSGGKELLAQAPRELREWIVPARINRGWRPRRRSGDGRAVKRDAYLAHYQQHSSGVNSKPCAFDPVNGRTSSEAIRQVCAVLSEIKIENFKSIEDITLKLGRVNVFVGENGAGKSNILEAIALSGAAHADKLDNEFLASRGIRVCNPQLMRSAFAVESSTHPIKVSIKTDDGSSVDYELKNDNKPYSPWEIHVEGAARRPSKDFFAWLGNYTRHLDEAEKSEFADDLMRQMKDYLDSVGPQQLKRGAINIPVTLSLTPGEARPLMTTGALEDFIIFSPENSALRSFEREGQIEPLGINGEGLLKFLGVLSAQKNKDTINLIKESLRLFNWFDDFTATKKKTSGRLDIVDHFLDPRQPSFDQRSANEGFLYLAFYFALFASSLTPRFFAVDNVDASLNPKLCQQLMHRLSDLAASNGKQVILTTHNPAILDGLDLNNPENRLFIISRSSEGRTRIRRFLRKSSDETPRRLSALFISGALGGLPKGF